MFRLLKFILCFILAGSAVAQEVSEELMQILLEIDRVENELSMDIKSLKKSFELLDKSFENISADLSEIEALKENIEKRYRSVLQSEANLKAFQEKIEKNIEKMALFEAKLNELDKGQTRIESDVNSSQSIVTWVTLIVTVVVILIGLFFSKHFLDLYANYKVLSSKMADDRGVINKVLPDN